MRLGENRVNIGLQPELRDDYFLKQIQTISKPSIFPKIGISDQESFPIFETSITLIVCSVVILILD